MFTRDCVAEFTAKMEDGLLEKAEEHGEYGWLGDNCSVDYLKNKLAHQVTRLKLAVLDCQPERAEKACINIANFAMMISDRLSFPGGHPE